MSLKLRHLPNIITIARIVAILPLAWLMWHKDYKSALVIAFLAGLSDGLDGYLAKKYGWQGWLGGILDPLADKFLMFCCYTIFALQGIIPLWLFVMVILRDVVIVSGASFYHFKIGKIEKATPTLVSKLNTVMQIMLILVLLLSYSQWVNLFSIHQPLIVLVGLLTLISGLHYVWMGLSMAKKQNLERGQ